MTVASAKSERREGRGHLSSIDLLPEEAEPDIVWAVEQLRLRSMPQNAILKEFNARLADRGIKEISSTAWNRYSMRKARLFREIDQSHRIMQGVHESLSSDAPDQVTMVLGEMLKIAVYKQLENQAEGEELSAKELGNLARVLRHSVQAQTDTLEYRKAIEELNERLASAAKAVNAAGKKAGVSPDALAKITNLLTTGAV